ncbi:hypothetical protein PUNSTDRAFT_133961 [Punctularia strigosozonata HHB-11173 SS5]|uniref:uncharacterized protein n=1 Tax=Punctularia strigosozonata (strain HHB-11173) TaxID=741275 RepID=UPI0004416A6C|nr:uncharacterized protein PUNSTDRAFT_133961 [Punctularia strigosozonata HHB-11173 SS5]EIN08780.1 hypothetical protein PUNSTDRAFT_133961 [Punctularia strigosozonata HHB-11173 SS5]
MKDIPTYIQGVEGEHSRQDLRRYSLLLTITRIFFSPGFSGHSTASGAASGLCIPDQHAVSAQSYFAGPTYYTARENRSLLRQGGLGPYTVRKNYERSSTITSLRIGTRPAWKVVGILDTHAMVRFRRVVGEDEEDADDTEERADEEDDDIEDTAKPKQMELGPVASWIGVFPGTTSATAAHNAAQDIVALLKDYSIASLLSPERAEALAKLLRCVETEWNGRPCPRSRPSLPSLGIGGHRFTEDWGIFQVDWFNPGVSFQGTKVDHVTELTPGEFEDKCSTGRDAGWEFYDPCLSLVKNGEGPGGIIGGANGVFSIVREYFIVMSAHRTSLEPGIIKYDRSSEAVWGPGDFGSIIIRGRIGGMSTGGSAQGATCDWTLRHAPSCGSSSASKATGFPNTHLDLLATSSPKTSRNS